MIYVLYDDLEHRLTHFAQSSAMEKRLRSVEKSIRGKL